LARHQDKLKAKDGTCGRVIKRPATRQDILDFSAVPKWPTARAWIGEIDGEVVALGGLALLKGRWIAFVDITGRGREYLGKSLGVRVAFIRAIHEVLTEARAMGIRYIYAEAELQFPKAREVIERMGFHLDPRSNYLYRWTPHGSN